MKNILVAIGALTFMLAGLGPVSAQVQGQWTATGAMQSPRESQAQVAIRSDNVLAVGGVDNNGNILATAEIYSHSTGTWSLTASMQAAREAFPAVVLSNGNVLVSGGLSAGSVALAGAELFNTKTNTWSAAGTMSVARFGHTATLLPNGTVLVAGGCTVSGCGTDTATSEIYDPKTNSWSVTGSLNLARAYHAAVLLNTGAVLIVGGSAGGATVSCELYSPTTGKWILAASTNAARYRSGVTLLPDGKVLASGGVVTKYPMNSAELYDPSSNQWTPTGNMTIGRYGHSSNLLPDGTVLVAGGEGQSISCGRACTGYIPTPKADFFNEAAGTFTPAPPLLRALAYHAATTMTDGRGLVGGGSGYTATCCLVVPDTEFYTPLTMTFSSQSLNFGLMEVGVTSASQNVTITNVSGHPSDIASIVASGDFAQVNTCPATLAPTQYCTITVTFTPAVTGNRHGFVTIRDDDPGSAKQTIALAGVGEALALGFAPSSLNLGSVGVGSSSMLSATLTNDGSASVNITGIAMAPAKHTFTQTNNCPTTLTVQQSCTFQITFTPPDVANYKATLTVTNNAGAAATLNVKGTGLDGGG